MLNIDNSLNVNTLNGNVNKRFQISKSGIDTMIQAIEKYYSLGFKVFPVNITLIKNDSGELKKNVYFSVKWQKEAERINKNQAIKDAKTGKLNSLALLTGKESNCFVIDFDIRSSQDVKYFLNTYGVQFDGIPCVQTQAGGFHYYFAFPKFQTKYKTTSSKKIKGVDIRGNGGLVFIPPSQISEKNKYTWIREIGDKLPEITPEINAMLEDIFCKEDASQDIFSGNDHLSNLPLSQKQKETLEKKLKASANPNEPDRSGRDFNLIAWCIKCNLSRQNIIKLVRSVGKFAEKDSQNLFDDYFDRTYDKAFQDVKGNGKHPDPVTVVNNDQVPGPKAETPDQITDEFILECLKNDEKGDSELFASIYKNKRLYDHKAGSWMIYNSGVWEYDYKKLTRKQALYDVSRHYLNLSNKLDKDISASLLNDSGNENGKNVSIAEKRRDELRKRIKLLNKKSRIENILDLSTSFLTTLTDEFDNDNMLINLKNGIYDLKNNNFLNHSPKYLFSKKAGASYEPGARCPFIMNFLNTIFDNNQNVIKFIQEWAGITLTGSIDLQGFLYCYGNGSNGKTAFFALIETLLGDYYATIPIENLLEKRFNNKDEYHKVNLKGARLVVASEVPKNRRLNESQVKDLTGGESITARQPYGKPFNFFPTHKLALFGNHLLNITGTDEGIWRRVFLLNFNVTIPDEKKIDFSVLKAKFKQEINGFLIWCLDGWKRYQAAGKLNVPIEVQKATNEYRNESNTIKRFLESEFCQIGINNQCELKHVLNAYHNWTKENGEYIQYQNSRQLKKALIEQGFDIKSGYANKITVHGLKLNNSIE